MLNSQDNTRQSGQPFWPDEARQVPQNIQAEQELLGAIFINNQAFDRVSNIVNETLFYDPLHGRIFECAARLIGRGRQATPVTLQPYFDSEPPVGEITVAQYLGRLAVNATSIINAVDYARTIADLAKRRALIELCEISMSDAYVINDEASPNVLIEDMENQLFALAEKDKYGKGFRSLGEVSLDTVEMANNAYIRGEGLAGISTGLKDLDWRTGGLQRSDLIILAGRPSMGKTALATNIAVNVASDLKKAKKPGVVAFFSLEMSDEQLATRIISAAAKVPSERIRRGQIGEKEFARLVDQSKLNADVPLEIDATGGLTIAQIAARARRIQRQKGLTLIVIDYLQLLSGSKKTTANKTQEITEITTGLKALAKELDVPVLALSQLSRQVEMRSDKRPQLSDLRESGSIEQDADVVMFVYREEYYISREQPPERDVQAMVEWQGKMADAEGKAEVIISKQRHGPVGTATLAFNGNFTQFSDLREGRDG